MVQLLRMIVIDDKIISIDLFDIFFECDYSKCKGICCIEGDSGAPLEIEEITKIEEALPKIKKYLSPKAITVIEKQGATVVDNDGDLVTPLIDSGACVYATFDENGNCLCAFEKSFLQGESDFQKPISCALYPIRITKYRDFTAVNYHKWDVCHCAIKRGAKKQLPAFRFLSNPIKRAFGEDFYEKLEEAYILLQQRKEK